MRLLAEPADYAIKVSPKFGVRKISGIPGNSASVPAVLLNTPG
jgi:hypothetical protein